MGGGTGGLIGAVNNLAIQYNLAAASVAVSLVKDSLGPPPEDDADVDTREPMWAQHALVGLVWVSCVGDDFCGSLGFATTRNPGYGVGRPHQGLCSPAVLPPPHRVSGSPTCVAFFFLASW